MTGESEAQHTPGPWEFGSGDNYYVRADAYPKNFPHHFKSDDLGDYLAYVGNRTDDFGEANARLIASAPELFEYVASSAAAGCATATTLIARITSGDSQTTSTRRT